MVPSSCNSCPMWVAEETQGRSVPNRVRLGGLDRFLSEPQTKIHLVFDFQGSGSVENCKLFLVANCSQTSSMSTIALLVGARRRMSSQKPTAPMNTPCTWQPTPNLLNSSSNSSMYTAKRAGLKTDPCPVVADKEHEGGFAQHEGG